jgi:hypothetical protein
VIWDWVGFGLAAYVLILWLVVWFCAKVAEDDYSANGWRGWE